MASSVIRNFVAKALFKKKGAIANNKAVEFSANALEQRIKKFGIDTNAITSEQELNQILSAVKQAEDQAFSQRFGNMLGGSRFDRQGEVFDMTGKKLDSSRGIMGGTQIDEKSLKEGLMKTDNPFSDLVKTTDQGPKTLKEREAEVLARMNRENKEAAQRIRDRKADEKQFNKDVEEAGSMEEFLNKNPIDDDTGDFATGGRAGFKLGTGEKFLKFLKKFKVKQSGDDLKDFLSKRQFMKDAVGNTEKNRKARQLAEIKEAMKDAKGFEFPSGEELRTDIEKKIAPILLKDRKLNATGGRAGYADGTPDKTSLLDMLDIQASGSKSGKQQIVGAPDGITIDSESINAIIKADIPISQKIDLIAEYKYGKGRNRIERDGQELFLDEGGYKDQDIGFGYNQGGDGFSGSVIRDLRTGDDEFKINFKKNIDFNRLFRADGGRIGLKAGMTKRAFMKLIGGIGATIGAAKSGIFTGLGKGATKQAAKEVVQQSTTTPPPYFFELANKIKKFGTDTTPTNDRTIAKSMKSKDGKSDYILEQDVTSGDTIIKKVNKEGDNMITDVQMMELRKGEIVGGKDGKAIRTADEYEEVTETNSRINKDNYNASDYVDGIEETEIKKIIDEASEQAPSIKKAGGGIARMLGE